MKLTIELSEKQLKAITEALDLYSRILCGQLRENLRVIQYADFNRTILSSQEDTLEAERAIQTLGRLLFPEVYPAQYSICNPATLPSIAAIAYDIYQVIRKMENPKSSLFKTSSQEELPTITKVEA